MASRHETKDFRQEFLICSICQDPFENENVEKVPKCLPCLHCFCVSCLRHIIAGKAEIKCPTCRMKSSVPENGAEGFVTNFTIECLKDYQHLHDIGRNVRNEGQLCTNCEQEDLATGYCYDCCEYVCQQCTEEHHTSRIRRLRNHQITALSSEDPDLEPRRRTAEQYCKVHTTTRKALTLFCRTCLVPICDTCGLAELHRKHDLVGLEGAVKETVGHLKELSALINNKKKPVEVISKLLDPTIKEVQALRAQQQQLIDDTFHLLETKLREKKAMSKEKIGEQCKCIEKILREQKDDVDALITQFDSAFDFADHTCRYANPVQLFEHCNMVTQQLNDLIGTDTDVPCYTQLLTNNVFSFTQQHNEALKKFEEVLDHLGKMQTSTTVAYLCQLEGFVEIVQINTRQDVSIRTFKRDGTPQTDGGDNVTVILQAPDGTETECQVEDSKDGQYAARFNPDCVGNYYLHVRVYGKPIKGSPFQLTIIESEARDQVFIVEDFPVAMVGHAHEIIVNISKDVSGREEEAAVHRLKAEVITQAGSSVPCQVRGPENKQFIIRYTPFIEGPIRLHLLLNDTQLPESPYTIFVSSVSPSITTVSYEKPIRNQNWPIIITPFSHHKKRVCVPEEAIEAKVVNLEDQSESSLPLISHEDGAYIAHFVPRHIRYKLIVLLHKHRVTEEVVDVMDYQEFMISERTHNFPTGIANSRSNLVYVSDTTDGKIHVLAPNGSLEYDINLEANQTSQIAVDKKGRLILLFPQNKEVHYLDQKGNRLSQWRCHKRNSKPVTMTSTKDGRVVVADSREPSMFIYQSDGTVITRQVLPKNSVIDGINNMCVDDQNRIVLAHHTSPTIYLYDTDGRPLFHFESGASSQLAITATAGNLLLVSQLGNIQVINMVNNEQCSIAQIPIVSGHIYTSLASTPDGCCLCLDVGQNKIVKYGYKGEQS